MHHNKNKARKESGDKNNSKKPATGIYKGAEASSSAPLRKPKNRDSKKED